MMPSAYRAFTLIELLVVIAIVAGIVSLALPSLWGARRSARMTKSTVSMREYVVATSSYADDYRGGLPYLAEPGRPWRGIVLDGESIDQPYFFQSFFVGHVLLPTYLASDVMPYAFPGGLRPFADRGYHVSHVMLTATAFAQSEFWRATRPRPASDSLYRGERLSNCAFPSRKVMYFNSNYRDYGRNPSDRHSRPMYSAFDGHAAVRRLDPDWERFMSERPWGGMPYFGVLTIDGVRGVDW